MPVALPPDSRRNQGLPPPIGSRAALGQGLPQAGTSELSLFKEKIAASVLSGRLQFLPWLDKYTQETPAMRRCYREMMKSPVVKAALTSKVFSVASLDLQSHPEDETPRAAYVAECVRDAILACQGGLLKIAETIL